MLLTQLEQLANLHLTKMANICYAQTKGLAETGAEKEKGITLKLERINSVPQEIALFARAAFPDGIRLTGCEMILACCIKMEL